MFDVATISYVADTRGLRDAASEMEKVERRSDRVERASNRLGRALRAAFAGFSLAAAIREFARLEDKVSEVVTLFDRTQLGDLGFTQTSRQIQRELEIIAAQSGQASTTLSQGLFDIVSAGTGDQQEALQLLREANELAIAGATDVSTAVSGVTGIINAYSLSAADAEAITESLFVTQKFGVTTVEELSNSIGRVAPLANALGIELNELLAAQAGITSVTQNQSEAVSGLRAALSNVLKPTEDARKAAELLGVEFNAQALEAKGLTVFLQDIVDATGGNVDAMSALFGSVEGVNTVLALTGGGADAYRDSLEALNDETRRSELFNDALNGRLETVNQRLSQLGQTFSGVLSAFGSGFTESFLGGFLDEITGSEEALQQLLAGAETAGRVIGAAFAAIAKAAQLAFEAIKLIGPALLAIGAAGAVTAIARSTSQLILLQRALGASSLASATLAAGVRSLAGTTGLLLAPFRALAALNPFALAVGGATLLGTLFFRLRGGAQETTEQIERIPAVIKTVTEEINEAGSALSDYRQGLSDVQDDTNDLFKANETLARAIRDTGTASLEAARQDVQATEQRLEQSQRRLTVLRLELEAQLAQARAAQRESDLGNDGLRQATGLQTFITGPTGEADFIREANDLLEQQVQTIIELQENGGILNDSQRETLDFYTQRTAQLREIETLSRSIADIDRASAQSRQAAIRGVGSVFGIGNNEAEETTTTRTPFSLTSSDTANEIQRAITASNELEQSINRRAIALQDLLNIQQLERDGSAQSLASIAALREQRALEAIEIEKTNKLKELSALLDGASAEQRSQIQAQIQDVTEAYESLAEATRAQTETETQRILAANDEIEKGLDERAQRIRDSIQVQELEAEGTLEAKIAIEELRVQRELEAIAIERSNRLKVLSARLDRATPAQARAIEKEINDLNRSYDRLAEATRAQSQAAIEGFREAEAEANSFSQAFNDAIDGLFDGDLSFKDIGKRLLNDLRGAFLAPFRDSLKGLVNNIFSGQGGQINVQGITGPLGQGVQSIFNNLNLGGLLSKLSSGLSGIFNSIFGGGSGGGLAGAASGLVGGAGNIGIPSGLSGTLGSIASIAGPIGLLAGAFDAISGLFRRSPRLEGFFGGSGGEVDLTRADTRSGVGTEIAEQIGEGINDILRTIGASVNDALQFSVLFKPEKDFLRIKFTDSLFQDFKASEVEDALSFAIRTILSDPALSSGVSDELRAQLNSGSITSLDELQRVIEEDLARIQALFNPFFDSFRTFASELERQPQLLADAASGIRDYLDNLNFNQFSNLTPNQQLQLARTQFDELFARAQAGDIDAIRGLTASADRLLGISRQVNASNTEFQADRQNVVDALSQVERITQTAGDRATAQLAELQQINEILAGGITVNNINDIIGSLERFGIGSTGSDGTIFAANQATVDFVAESLALLRASAAQAGINIGSTTPTLNPTTPGEFNPFDPRFFNGITREEFNQLITLTRQTNQSLAQIASSAQQTANNTADTNDGLEATINAIEEGNASNVVNPTETPNALVTVGATL